MSCSRMTFFGKSHFLLLGFILLKAFGGVSSNEVSLADYDSNQSSSSSAGSHSTSLRGTNSTGASNHTASKNRDNSLHSNISNNKSNNNNNNNHRQQQQQQLPSGRDASTSPPTTPSTNWCAHYDDHPSARPKHGGVDRFSPYKTLSGDDTNDLVGLVFPGNTSALCRNNCYTLWMGDPRNRSKVAVIKQGCWLKSEGLDCDHHRCTSDLPPRQNNTHFCCCSGHMCNQKFEDIYDPTQHTSTTASTQLTPLAIGPLHDHSYRKKTIVIALVSVTLVSVVIFLSYLTYRLCVSPKPSSPQSSVVTRPEGDHEAAPSDDYNMDDLKILDVMIRGRYSEIRKGLLNEKEVAVKIYQPHHRQYYYNERNAFSLPHMDHENLVKFFGAKEQEDVSSNLPQYLIVTQFMPLGSLSNYLKNNTLDWFSLCRMCQGVARGLAHLHTDIQKGELFKPALAHRDLNTRNILVTPDLNCVVADLGFAVGMMGSKLVKNGVTEYAEQASLADVGTLRYMAPEVFDGAVNLRDCEASLKQIDIYALALVMWELASRCLDLYQGAPVPEYQLPFQAEGGVHPTFEEMQVLVVKYKTRPKFPEVWKDSNAAVRSLKETIEDCWDADAEARLTALCVQERIADMAVLWIQGARQRGVTPTLNATMNLPEGTLGSLNSSSAVVSNGVTYLPSYIDRSEELIVQGLQPEGVRPAVPESPIISSTFHRQGDETGHSAYEEVGDGESITAPLISNVGQLMNSTSSSCDTVDGRLRSWLHDQSVSESTMDTNLPPTPSNLRDNLVDELNDAGHLPELTSQPPTVIKANNVMLAKNKAVILHPNQGRNPTVERNTHKRSDEELTVSGNRLVAPGDPPPSVANRRNSLGTHSAPPNQSGEGGSFDGVEAVESSALVQNDTLNQVNQQRTMPIPYLQNRVHGDGGSSQSNGSHRARPKLANTNGNRGSYLRLQGDDSHLPVDAASDSSSQCPEAKSLKYKLGRLIRPKELGHKFSCMVFGTKGKKGQLSSTASNADVERGDLEKNRTNRNSGQYINSGLEASPVGRAGVNTSHAAGQIAAPMAVEVQMINGSAVTRTCSSATQNNPHHSSNIDRISATNVMRLGSVSMDQQELPSPSLFPRNADSTTLPDVAILTSSLEQEKAVPLQNLVTSLSAKDYGSMHLTDSHPANRLSDPFAQCESNLSIEAVNFQKNLSHNHPNSASLAPPPLHLLSSKTNIDSKNLAPQSIIHRNSAVTSSVTDTPLYDDGTQSTAIQSPQNKTLFPLNTDKPLSPPSQPGGIARGRKHPRPLSQPDPSVSGPCPKNASSNQSTTCEISSQCSHVKDLSVEELPSSNTHDSQQKMSRKLLIPNHELMHTLSDRALDCRVSLKKDVPNVTPISGKLGQSRSTTDLEKHQRGYEDYQDDRVAAACRSQEEEWEDKNQFSFSHQLRPQSLSLKGHNYNHLKPRGRSVSTCSSSSSSSRLPLSRAVESGVKVSSKEALNNRVEKGNLTVIVPNVTLGKNGSVLQSSSVKSKSVDISKGSETRKSSSILLSAKPMAPPPVSLPSPEMGNGTGSVSMGAVEAGGNTKHSLKVKGRADSGEKIRRRVKTPVSFNKGRLSLYDDRLMTQSLELQCAETSGPSSQTGHGLVEGGLMTQSLGPGSLVGYGGDNNSPSAEEKGDSNNNNGGTQKACIVTNGPTGSGDSQTDQDRDLGQSRDWTNEGMRTGFHHNMIQSGSDIIV